MIDKESSLLSASDVAKYFITLVCVDEGDSISNLKLQRLLYFAQGFHLGQYNLPLFREDIILTDDGPVVPSVYAEYAVFDHKNIPIPIFDSSIFTESQTSFMNLIYRIYGSFVSSILLYFIRDYIDYHQVNKGEVIPIEHMRQYFQVTLVERKRS